jgi:hypothetical protein
MTPLPKCRWCGGAPHYGEHCPLVAALEFDSSGEVTRVEFHAPQPGVGSFAMSLDELNAMGKP